MNSITELDSIGVSDKDIIIPESTSAVRIDLVGGFALQKVTSKKSFVRVIGELDIKLDLVPPSLMNFISRQIVGKGFRLYKKAAGSVAKKLDEDFSRALADPLYINIHHAMYSTDKSTEEEEQKLEANIEMNGNSETKNKHEVLCRRAIMEIEEKKEEEEESIEECVSFEEEENVHGKSNGDIRRQCRISPEVLK
ncbi:Polyketide cyclase/dehydrase and lipid transport superfamily protein [Raphanus sativus]|nr:Polyketide cyclase/dehydrase and lipid transport superfamily protein [Raphanus sativus]